MSKKLEINLKVWGMSFDELNAMSYEEIMKLAGMNRSLLFTIMSEITNIETVREYLQDNKRSLV